MQSYSDAEAATSKPDRSARIISFYRDYATRCEIAARNAPNQKMRAELAKMVPVWRDFAALHEEMVRTHRDFIGGRCTLKGWM